MSLIFRYKPNRGENKDPVTGTIPTISGNYSIKNTSKGRAGYYGGAESLNFGNIADIADGDATILCAYRLIKQDSTFRRILDKRDGNDAGVVIDANSNGQIRCLIEDTVAQTAFKASSGRVDDNKFHLSIATINRTSGLLELLHDNTSEGTADISGIGSLTNTADLVLGDSNAGGLFLDGFELLVEVYNHAFSNDESEQAWVDFQNAQTITEDTVLSRDTIVGNFNGSSYVYKAISNFLSNHDKGSIEARVRTGTLNYQNIFSSSDEATNTAYLLFRVDNTGKLRFFLREGGVDTSLVGTTVITGDTWRHVKLSCDGVSSYLFVDEVEEVLTIETNNNGRWFSSVAGRDNFVLGALKYNAPASQFLVGGLSDVIIRDGDGNKLYEALLNERGGAIAYDSVSGNDGTWVGSNYYRNSRIHAVLNISGLNWNVGPQVKTAGQSIGDFQVVSGSFQIVQDVTGKKIVCITAGSLEFLGFDFSEWNEHGFIRQFDGSFSSDSGDTVDSAGSVSFASNILTIGAFTTDQFIRNLVIARSEK